VPIAVTFSGGGDFFTGRAKLRNAFAEQSERARLARANRRWLAVPRR
jgi:hypothetical protein